MTGACSVVINGQSVSAKLGETLVDAALGGWMIIPHDCRSGQCETCRVTVVSGNVDPKGTSVGRTVLACQATVSGSAEIAFDLAPEPRKTRGVISEINVLSTEIVEIIVALPSPFECRPGQYVRMKCFGFPSREYSPSCRLDGELNQYEMVFHIRRLRGGLISTQLGTTIPVGHSVQIEGPFGQAYLREGQDPLVLVAGGTGWAPIWALARAARSQQRHRPLSIIVGSRDPQSFYMRSAIEWLIDDGVRNIIATTEVGASDPVLPGRPTHYLPLLGPEDTVYVAGPSGLVNAVKQKARWDSARCYADPFLPSNQMPSLVDRVMQMLRGGQKFKSTVFSPRPTSKSGRVSSPVGARRFSRSEPKPALAAERRQTDISREKKS
jgi:3-phenylpropionate/trans-cinnamate dioxygenase ferredoxin reductase subunit